MPPNEISETAFLEALRTGVRRTTNLIARVTDYHGGAVRIEYMLTADLAREFVERDYKVAVEYLYRNLVNAMVALEGARPHKALRAKRTDIALLHVTIPLAMIEVKISVRRLSRVKGDLNKITAVMAMMQAKYAAKVIGAVVFQVHVPGSRSLCYPDQFKAAVEKIEQKLETEVAVYSGDRSDFSFKMYPLQGPNEGFVGREVEPDGDGFAWGQDGHGTRYHVILIRSTRPVPPSPRTIEELKRESES
jgi:hypothetical protein